MQTITITIQVPDGVTVTVGQPPAQPPQAPPGQPPQQPPAPPPVIPQGPADFNLAESGHTIETSLEANVVRYFGVDIPEGFNRYLIGRLLNASYFTIEGMKVRMWFSKEPRGVALTGSEYDGDFIQNVMPTPEGFVPPAGRVYFNVMSRDKPGSMRVQLTAQDKPVPR